nr:hypothetical protein CFP56_09088 [Quercus suber]
MARRLTTIYVISRDSRFDPWHGHIFLRFSPIVLPIFGEALLRADLRRPKESFPTCSPHVDCAGHGLWQSSSRHDFCIMKRAHLRTYLAKLPLHAAAWVIGYRDKESEVMHYDVLLKPNPRMMRLH